MPAQAPVELQTVKSCPVPGCRPLRDCKPSMCARCQTEDAAERAAIQQEGRELTPDAWRMAVAFVQGQRQRGQRELLAG